MSVFLMFCADYIPGTDGILLGAETLRGLYPVDAVSTVGRICAEVCLPIFIYE
jgi:pyruvate kinase